MKYSLKLVSYIPPALDSVYYNTCLKILNDLLNEAFDPLQCSLNTDVVSEYTGD